MPIPLSRTQNSQAVLLPPGAAVNLGGPVAAKLEGVGDQILEQLRQLDGVRLDGRQRIDLDDRAGFRDARLKVRQGVLHAGLLASVGSMALPFVPTRE